mmetsp:Transcript_31488/g.30981  ORF Transcript_31488/g.30981 Transcript_31488/m.30981 type:complete len:143 (+) Transcript_31488:1177-1605(+)
MVAFTNFKKLAFPSSMPDNKNDIKNGESRGGSALEHRDNTSHYKPLSGPNKQSGKEEVKGGLNGRKSEEPPDRISYKIKRITSGKREDNASPDYSNKNMKTIPKDKISLKSDKPVQIIMKVGNLFLSNVNQASFKNTHEEED